MPAPGRPGYARRQSQPSAKPPEGILLFLLVVTVLVTLASIVIARRPAADVFSTLGDTQAATTR
jgi:hypothetical protein